MKIKVVVVDTEAEFNEWMFKQKPAFPKELPGKKQEATEVETEVETIEVNETI